MVDIDYQIQSIAVVAAQIFDRHATALFGHKTSLQCVAVSVFTCNHDLGAGWYCRRELCLECASLDSKRIHLDARTGLDNRFE